jgi:hypothetical protein
MPDMEDHSSSNGTFDPTQRRLCPDGTCVGIVGPDGRCGECGRTEAQAAAGEEPIEPSSSADAAGSAALGDAPAVGPGRNDVGFDPTRRLCDDGTCVGVIGDDGTCRACGRRAE